MKLALEGWVAIFFVDITDDKKDFALFANIQRAHLLREVSNCQYCRPGLEKPDTGGDEIPSAPIEPWSAVIIRPLGMDIILILILILILIIILISILYNQQSDNLFCIM